MRPEIKDSNVPIALKIPEINPKNDFNILIN